MFWRRPRVKCFNATYIAGSYASRADLGYQVVPVASIVGSVGRCEELDDRFRPLKSTHLRQRRLANIRRLVNRGDILPPVQLYKLKDEYFVVDGHHRVAVAKENGQVYIDANVIEFLPDGERAEDRLYLERHAFVRETGLDGLRTNRLGGYARLRQEIEEHRGRLTAERGGSVALKEAASDWQRQVYQPVARAIRAARLPARLPGRTVADLYLDMGSLRAYFRGEEGLDLSWQEMIGELVAMHPLPGLGERLRGAWGRRVEGLRAWWRGLRAGEMPCSFALEGAGGTVYCRRAGRAKRGTFQP